MEIIEIADQEIMSLCGRNMYVVFSPDDKEFYIFISECVEYARDLFSRLHFNTPFSSIMGYNILQTPAIDNFLESKARWVIVQKIISLQNFTNI